MSYTLPEITIEGRADSHPVNAADWYCDGFMFGWNRPEATAEAPAPLREDLLSAYFEGVTAGQQARRAAENDAAGEYDGPAIGPDLGGESYEELERQWREAWSEFLNHREEPHIEPPGIEFIPR